MNIEIIKTALGEYGVSEYKNENQNPVILNYFKEIGKSWVTTDETAWCSAFVNWVALKCKKPLSGKLTARSWLIVGDKITNPILGDVVVFWREHPKTWKGHVGFFMGYSEDKKFIYCLGGNQNNQVNIKAYPVKRLLGFRRL